MKLLTVFAVLLLLQQPLFAQKEKFPAGWTGNWKGELHWYKTGNPQPQKVMMELRIQPVKDSAGQYTWQLIYGKETEDNRPYLLKAIDTTQGHWAIDEKNGIVLDQYWVGQKFCGAFTVQGNTIVNNYWLDKGKLMVEFYSYPVKPVATTGGTDKDTPPVDSYAIRSYQRAVLVKQKK